MLRKSEHFTKGRKRTKATTVVAQICTEDVLNERR